MAAPFAPTFSYQAAMCDVLSAAQSEDGGFVTAAEIQRILKKHGLPTNPTAPLEAVVSRPAPAGELQDVRFAYATQKEEIIRLINNPCISRAEKTRHLLSINKLTEGDAALTIGRLRQAIAEREELAAA